MGGECVCMTLRWRETYSVCMYVLLQELSKLPCVAIADRAILSILKCINQNMIFPVISIIRRFALGRKYPVQDVRNAWRIDVEIHQGNPTHPLVPRINDI